MSSWRRLSTTATYVHKHSTRQQLHLHMVRCCQECPSAPNMDAAGPRPAQGGAQVCIPANRCAHLVLLCADHGATAFMPCKLCQRAARGIPHPACQTYLHMFPWQSCFTVTVPLPPAPPSLPNLAPGVPLAELLHGHRTVTHAQPAQSCMAGQLDHPKCVVTAALAFSMP